MVTAGAVKLVMVAVVRLGKGLIPPKWRGGDCLTAGVCPNPENSPDPMGVPVNPGGGLIPRGRAETRSGEKYPEGRSPLPWGYPHGWQLSEMNGP